MRALRSGFGNTVGDRIRLPPAASRVEPASDGHRWPLRSYAFSQERTAERGSSRLALTSFPGHIDMMQRLDLTDNERAILITALRRLVDLGPLSPQTPGVEGDPRTAGAAAN
jgi:hypothetical protein